MHAFILKIREDHVWTFWLSNNWGFLHEEDCVFDIIK
jgi:hypothetical protein